MTARVLVVDDVPANVRLLEARLSAEYFDVITAMSGAEALAICERAECDLVLLDVMMPDMDGFEVCRRLKSNTATHHIPVVMVTALDQPSDKVRGLEAGADDFLTLTLRAERHSRPDPARPALRHGPRAGSRRRRFFDQADPRTGAHRAGALAVAAQDGGRRIAHAGGHFARHRPAIARTRSALR
jgi:CheY-like chemotaxis protein